MSSTKTNFYQNLIKICFLVFGLFLVCVQYAQAQITVCNESCPYKFIRLCGYCPGGEKVCLPVNNGSFCNSECASGCVESNPVLTCPNGSALYLQIHKDISNLGYSGCSAPNNLCCCRVYGLGPCLGGGGAPACAPDIDQPCCESDSVTYDESATAGYGVGLNCYGAVGNSCWTWAGGFDFPDAKSGEIYNDYCCGDDTGEYFVGTQGVNQGRFWFVGPGLSRSCDGTMACCRSDSAPYSGWVKSGQCVANCSIVITPTSLGYLKILHPTLGVIKLNLIRVADHFLKSPFPGMVKVARFNGDVNTAADLVPTTDPNASPVRIYTGRGGNGIWAWKMIP